MLLLFLILGNGLGLGKEEEEVGQEICQKFNLAHTHVRAAGKYFFFFVRGRFGITASQNSIREMNGAKRRRFPTTDKRYFDPTKIKYFIPSLLYFEFLERLRKFTFFLDKIHFFWSGLPFFIPCRTVSKSERRQINPSALSVYISQGGRLCGPHDPV